VPKNVFGVRSVRSMNWSTITNVPGGRSGLSEPTALTEMTLVTPARLSASMLARKLISCGGMRWPRPWRGKNTSSCVPSRPNRSSSEGAPNGLSTRCQRCSVRPSSS
jgi:hypothetical protein